MNGSLLTLASAYVPMLDIGNDLKPSGHTHATNDGASYALHQLQDCSPFRFDIAVEKAVKRDGPRFANVDVELVQDGYKHRLYVRAAKDTTAAKGSVIVRKRDKYYEIDIAADDTDEGEPSLIWGYTRGYFNPVPKRS